MDHLRRAAVPLARSAPTATDNCDLLVGLDGYHVIAVAHVARTA